jgi:hypothetical protein
MHYQRTQVYLDPEDHRALSAEAARRGLSLAALIRELVARRRVVEGKSFDAIIGLWSGAPTDVARDQRDLLQSALEARLKKKLGRKR